MPGSVRLVTSLLLVMMTTSDTRQVHYQFGDIGRIA